MERDQSAARQFGHGQGPPALPLAASPPAAAGFELFEGGCRLVQPDAQAAERVGGLRRRLPRPCRADVPGGSQVDSLVEQVDGPHDPPGARPVTASPAAARLCRSAAERVPGFEHGVVDLLPAGFRPGRCRAWRFREIGEQDERVRRPGSLRSFQDPQLERDVARPCRAGRQGRYGAERAAAQELRSDPPAGRPRCHGWRHQHDGPAAGPQVSERVLSPGQFRLGLRRDAVLPARIAGQRLLGPVTAGERRVADHRVGLQPAVGVLGQRISPAHGHFGLPAPGTEAELGQGGHRVVEFLAAGRGRSAFEDRGQGLAGAAGRVQHNPLAGVGEFRHQRGKRRRRRHHARRFGVLPGQRLDGPLRADLGDRPGSCLGNVRVQSAVTRRLRVRGTPGQGGGHPGSRAAQVCLGCCFEDRVPQALLRGKLGQRSPAG